VAGEPSLSGLQLSPRVSLLSGSILACIPSSSRTPSATSTHFPASRPLSRMRTRSSWPRKGCVARKQVLGASSDWWTGKGTSSRANVFVAPFAWRRHQTDEGPPLDARHTNHGTGTQIAPRVRLHASPPCHLIHPSWHKGAEVVRRRRGPCFPPHRPCRTRCLTTGMLPCCSSDLSPERETGLRLSVELRSPQSFLEPASEQYRYYAGGHVARQSVVQYCSCLDTILGFCWQTALATASQAQSLISDLSTVV
jgi:hypothetical protein